MLRDTSQSVIESEVLALNQLPSPNLAAGPETSEKHSFLRRCVGTLAVVSTVWMGPTMARDMDTAEAVTELAIHDAGNIIRLAPPSLEYHSYNADQAIQKTYRTFHLHGGFYIDNLESVSGFASTWHQYQVLNMLNIANLLEPNQGYDQKMSQAQAALNTYWSDSPAGYPAGYDATRKFAPTAPDRYVDDNLWLAQFLMQQHLKTGDQSDFDRVKEIMDLYLSQQQPDGGAYWKVQLPSELNHGRVMASNATAIPTLIEMYLSTGDEKYWTAAQKTYNWAQQLLDPKTGLYFDNISPSGQVDKTFYTYNMGEMLYAMTEFNKVDPVTYPLSDAEKFAQITMDYFSQHASYGISKFDAIYFPTLMSLAAQVNNPTFTAKVKYNLNLAKDAVHDSPASLADAASAAAVISLAELPLDKWSVLQG